MARAVSWFLVASLCLLSAVATARAQGRSLAGAECSVVSTAQGVTPGPARVTFECSAGPGGEEIYRATLTLPAGWSISRVTGSGWAVTASYVAFGGVGTNIATISHAFHDPCTPHSGIIDQSPAQIVVDVDPCGDTGGTVTYMLEGDRNTFDQTSPAVVCTTQDPCSPDPCYAGYGVDDTLVDLSVGGVPVTLQRFSVE